MKKKSPLRYPTYRIRPNNRTVRLGFSKLFGTLSCVKTCIDLLRVHYKKDQKRTFDDDFFMKAYIVGTHFNCIDLSMQFNEYTQDMSL